MRNSVTNSDGYCDTYTHSNGWAQAHPNATAPADASASPVAASRKELLPGNSRDKLASS